MSALNQHCSAELFAEYFCGVLPESDAAELTAHLVSCSECQDRAMQISDALLHTNTWLRDTQREATRDLKVMEGRSLQSSAVRRAETLPLAGAEHRPIVLQEQSSRRHRVLTYLFGLHRGYQAHAKAPRYALAVATIALCSLAWWSHLQRQRFSESEVNLSRAVKSLKTENALLSQKNAALSQQLDQAIESQRNEQHVEATLRTSLSKWVSDLVTNGEVKPTERVQLAMASLTTSGTRGVSTRTEEPSPLPLAPVRTGIRTTTPTLRWHRVSGAVEYSVTLAYAETENDGKVIWEDSVDARDHVTVPGSLLKEGHSYLWQVKARVGRRLLSSPAVGFWVTDPESLRDVEIGEREYHDSALARAALYERHGLYEEALAEVERLNKANPKSPATQEMLRNLHSKLGMNGTEE